MKKLVSAMACFMICFSVQGQIQIENGETRQQNANENRSAGVRIVSVPQSGEQKAVEAKREQAVPHQHKTDCPKAATCPKAAANAQGEAPKPCCAKHQESRTAADAKTAPKTGCNHQHNADHKCNHGSGNQPASPKKVEGKK